MAKKPDPESTRTTEGTCNAVAAAAACFVHPAVVPLPVTDPLVLDRIRLFGEAERQMQPLAAPGSASAKLVANVVKDGTAMPNGITAATAERYATETRSLDAWVSGGNPGGKVAELVVAFDYRELHAGRDPGIVNPPKRIAPNVLDMRVSPDPCSQRDLLAKYGNSTGHRSKWKPHAQVKTGRAAYVAPSLVEMAQTSDYGKVGFVDARFVNADGTPRVGRDAFTIGQAQRLQDSEVCLRGFPNLEARRDRLMQDIEAFKVDGLDPAARHEARQVREQTVSAYGAKGTTKRIVGAAPIAAGLAAVTSVVFQLAAEGKVDAKVVGEAAGSAAASGAAGAAADAVLYHLAANAGIAPEAAMAFAQQGVAAGFCAIAIGTDIAAEVAAARRGDITVAGAIGGGAARTGLDLLPLAMAPLGIVGLPLLIGAQIGGRWLLGKARAADRALEAKIRHDLSRVDDLVANCGTLADESARFFESTQQVTRECDRTSALFRQVMGADPAHLASPNLQAVTA